MFRNGHSNQRYLPAVQIIDKKQSFKDVDPDRDTILNSGLFICEELNIFKISKNYQLCICLKICIRKIWICLKIYHLLDDRPIGDNMLNMKGEITLKFLGFIKDFANFNMDMFEAFLRAGYGASYGKLDYELNKLQKDRRVYEMAQDEARACRKRYAQFLYKLRRDGLIEEGGDKHKKTIFLTQKGIKKLNKLKEQYSNKLPSVKSYTKKSGNKFVIATFDVPEKERRKRAWIRSALKNIGLKSIQKSVWIGKAKIPQEFIDDLADLRLIDFIEIFEISKTGSLRHVV